MLTHPVGLFVYAADASDVDFPPRVAGEDGDGHFTASLHSRAVSQPHAVGAGWYYLQLTCPHL